MFTVHDSGPGILRHLDGARTVVVQVAADFDLAEGVGSRTSR